MNKNITLKTIVGFVAILFSQATYAATCGTAFTPPCPETEPVCGTPFTQPCPGTEPVCGTPLTQPCPGTEPVCGTEFTQPCPGTEPVCGTPLTQACPGTEPVCGTAFTQPCPGTEPVCGTVFTPPCPGTEPICGGAFSPPCETVEPVCGTVFTQACGDEPAVCGTAFTQPCDPVITSCGGPFEPVCDDTPGNCGGPFEPACDDVEPICGTAFTLPCDVVQSDPVPVMNPIYEPGTVTYLHEDALGSAVAATDVNGYKLWNESYEAYGEKRIKPVAAEGENFSFTGHTDSKETGLVYMGARYYDPVISRFMGFDPVGFVEDNQMSFNRYAYANNNPYVFIDPDGRSPELLFMTDPQAYIDIRASALGVDPYTKEGTNAVLSHLRDEGIMQASVMVTMATGGFGVEVFSLKGLLTAAQSSRVKTISNVIKENAKPHDFAGVKKELKGIKGRYDHITEMKQSVRALDKAINGLKGSLKNPNLNNRARKKMEAAVKKGTNVRDKMNKTLNGE